MPIKIASDHPTIALKTKVQELSHSFLSGFGFNYFQYLRCFADGSASLLTNLGGVIENFQNIDNGPVIFSSFNDSHENAHSYWFLWDEELPESACQMAREKFKVHNGLTLVRRSKNHYDMIAVGLPQEQPNAGSFYLNKLKGIEQFINNFDKDNRDLVNLMSKNPIALPEPNRDNNYKNICLTNGRANVYGKDGLTYITSQELGCLRLLTQGASYKEIARLLEVSDRTVETYIARIKYRTGLTTRSELEWMLSSCP